MANTPTTDSSWRSVGNPRECAYLTLEEVLQIHHELVAHAAATDDPIFPPGVKSLALLESAVARPQTSFAGRMKYGTAEDAAAALLHSIVHNHPFHNGNKRTALVATLVFLDRNNFIVESSGDELYQFMLDVAAHRLLERYDECDHPADEEVMRIAQRLGNRSRLMRKDERAITTQKLARRLRSLGCEVLESGKRWRVRRTVLLPRDEFGRQDRCALEVRVSVPPAGTEVPKSTLRAIRTGLHLDPDHAIDSDRFYSAIGSADDFIAEYSTLLKRLAAV